MTTLEDMTAKFGDEETEQYIRLAKATRALVTVWAAFIQAPNGSSAEAAISMEFDRMIDGVKQRPEHAASIIESLLALVQHMRMGGTYEEWFESLGISPFPIKDN